MQDCIYPTDPDWIAVLKANGVVDDVNFWRKDLRTLNLQPGAHFYFKVRRQPVIVGRGTFVRMNKTKDDYLQELTKRQPLALGKG
jgi:hypothetical protein